MHIPRPAITITAIALSLALGACGGDEEAAAPGTTSSTTTTTETTAAPDTTAPDTTAPETTAPDTTAPQAATTVDWRSRTATIPAPGWDVAFCEGEAPLLCVERGGTQLGVVEHLSFPLESMESMGAALENGDEAAALRAFAQEHLDTFVADRAEGCGEGYVVRGDTVTDAVVAGGEGIAYGFTGSVDEQVVEHAVGFATIRDGELHLVTAAGLADDGCLSRVSELTVEDLEAFRPHLAEIAAGSRF